MDRRSILLAATALLAAGGIGFTAARLTNGSNQAAEGSEEEHGEEHGEAGFVPLKPGEAAAAGITVTTIEAGAGSEVLLAGRVTSAPDAQSNVGAPLAGTVSQVHVAPGSRVSVGTPIATLRSADGASARASLDASAAAAEAARSAAARERRLFDAGVAARQDWETARAASLKAEADLRAARAQTAALGSPGSSGVTVVRSPIAGTVTRVVVAAGSVTAQGAEIANIIDPARAELVFDVPPASLGLVRVGAAIKAQRPDGQPIEGIVTAIAPGVAGGNGTVRARPSGEVPPVGSVISARLAVTGGGAITVPSEAVQTVDGVPSVFIAEAGGFRARPVMTGMTGAGRTEIKRGLSGNERIAGAGAFLLKAELAKGEAEHED
ncbi:efflux RND transporter periplasmic adaptor subunit [Sphingomonas sp. KC8]|uniref:efflux RND transporter periplasmic adaptor subunit n=1 Tax=Sphingomonas sp. KC8 TaxID=1030157 RepID=UPI000248B580|nr:efflux RND transporter periplasmic adaptor subunit [Sphingomonas sp. KC8]ARS26966.1 RND transporter [Sphingomonas sp. KC8]